MSGFWNAAARVALGTAGSAAPRARSLFEGDADAVGLEEIDSERRWAA